MSDINKKRRFSQVEGDHAIDPTPVKRLKRAPQYGREFNNAIDTMGVGSHHSAYTRMDMPLTYHNNKPSSVHLEATFATKTHNPTSSTSSWTQGWMDMGGETSYSKVLPTDLSLKQAVFESRVMKKLALGTGYTPKPTPFNRVTRKTDLPGLTKNWGRMSMQSYLEDVTGRTSLGVRDVGSAMRAKILSAKLQMRTSCNKKRTGFDQEMETSFPQLLTEKSVPPGGAAYYNNTIQLEQQDPPVVTNTQRSLYAPVVQAHKDVNRDSRNRFKFKWQEIESGRLSTTDAGQWWQSKFGTVTGRPLPSGKTAPTQLTKRSLKRDYVRHKLARHNINHYK